VLGGSKSSLREANRVLGVSKSSLREANRVLGGSKSSLREANRVLWVVLCFSVARADFNTHLGSLQDRMNVHAQKMLRQSKEKEVALQELEEIAPMGSGAFGLVRRPLTRRSQRCNPLRGLSFQCSSPPRLRNNVKLSE
jgi:hypothetical protein